MSQRQTLGAKLPSTSRQRSVNLLGSLDYDLDYGPGASNFLIRLHPTQNLHPDSETLDEILSNFLFGTE